MGDYKSPGFNRSNLFLRRISNPPGRLAGDFANLAGAKRLAEDFANLAGAKRLAEDFANLAGVKRLAGDFANLAGANSLRILPLGARPVRRSADLQSGVKKCPNLLMLCGFEIRSKQECY